MSKPTRREYIKLLTEEYRNLSKQEVEIHRRKDVIHEQLERLKDEQAIADASAKIFRG